MDDYVTPTFSLVAFGMGFAVAMFWPVYLAVIGGTLFAAIRRKWPRRNITVAALNALPFLVIALEAWAIRRSVDIGPRDGVIAQSLDNFHFFAVLAGPVAAILLGVGAVSRLIATRFTHAHS